MFQEFTGRQYLKIDIASNYGLDKKTWDERIAWFDEHEDELDGLVFSAENPALFYAGVKAWRDVQAGRPIGYMISLDATSSGLQLLAVLAGDDKASRLCNVIDTGRREDAYTGVYDVMLERLGEKAQISRDQTKRAIMTSLYGSTAVPKEVFGEGTMLTCFMETMTDLAPGAWELNQAFLQMWNSEALSNDWVLPDNFHVHVKVMQSVSESVHFCNAPYEITYKINAPIEHGRSLGANTIHSLDGMIVREMTRRCDYDPVRVGRIKHMLEIDWDDQCYDNEDDKMVVTLWNHYQRTGYLSARILDHLSTQNVGWISDREPVKELIDSLPKKPFKVLSVHDCFRCLPHYGNDLRRQYNLQLELIARSELLQNLASQIMGRPIYVTKINPNLHLKVREANYALS